MEHVNHPKHYQKGGKECIQEMLEIYGPIAVICFCVLNWFKYDWRAGEKEGNPEDQDHSKGEWYLKFAVNQYLKLSKFRKFILRCFHRTTFSTVRHYADNPNFMK